MAARYPYVLRCSDPAPRKACFLLPVSDRRSTGLRRTAQAEVTHEAQNNIIADWWQAGRQAGRERERDTDHAERGAPWFHPRLGLECTALLA